MRLGIKGYHLNGHVKTVDYELLKLLADTGCKKITFGIESGSERVLKKIKKSATPQEIREAFSMAKRAKIPVVEGTFVLGSDIYETQEDFDATIKLMKEIQPDTVGLGIISPFPGTIQYDELKKLGYLDNIGWDSFEIFSEEPPPWRIYNFSARELADIRDNTLKSFYWNPKFILKQLLKIRSFSELLYYAGMAKDFYRVVVKNK